ncbi:hypothetical protein [Alkalinema sp. FACHB-956]|uniref:hypothetical protein n=1 Tax=Alkalinema sp. FACHB-956 TaxID=2692768 RepID=UPI001683C177|nr:hypothetical protein [Alkalinema sp. FACHB-956]MBD2325838.1 hypothetical protein [Alkalinema sp. FACHB-956]
MNQQQPTSTHQATSQIAPIDPTPIAQSESPTAVILAIAILISTFTASLTGLVQVIMNARSYR